MQVSKEQAKVIGLIFEAIHEVTNVNIITVPLDINIGHYANDEELIIRRIGRGIAMKIIIDLKGNILIKGIPLIRESDKECWEYSLLQSEFEGKKDMEIKLEQMLKYFLGVEEYKK